MIKFVALYRAPEDTARFDEAYFSGHLPLLAKAPGLQRTEVGRVTRMMAGEPIQRPVAGSGTVTVRVWRSMTSPAPLRAASEICR